MVAPLVASDPVLDTTEFGSRRPVVTRCCDGLLVAMAHSPLDEFAALVASGQAWLDVTARRAHRGARSVELTAYEATVLSDIVAGRTSSAAGLDRVRDEHADPFNTRRRVVVMTLSRKVTGLL